MSSSVAIDHAVRAVLFLLIVIDCGFADKTELSNTSTSPCAPKSCRKSGSIDQAKPVCGSDGITYPNRCLLDLAHCANANVTLVHRSVCRKARPRTRCASSSNGARRRDGSAAGRKRSALPTDGDGATSTNGPECRPDGRFSASQCPASLGYCWCVTPSNGAPVPYTTIKFVPGKRLRCQRSTSTGSKKKKTRNSKGRKPMQQTRTCTSHDRALFNENLIRLFQTEWQRENTGAAARASAHAHQPSVASSASGTDRTAHDMSVLLWKFQKMDRDGSGQLERAEYRDFWRLARPLVKPKACARSFASTCDLNGDAQLSRHEWTECLRRDGFDGGSDDTTSTEGGSSISRLGGGPSIMAPIMPPRRPDMDLNDADDTDNEELPISSPRTPPHMLFGNQAVPNHQYEDDTVEHREDEATVCQTDRRTAIMELKSSHLYVPECTADGRFRKIQCYDSTGYCWCVNEDTGKNIPGTSVKDQEPRCDLISDQVPAMQRSMKGCPDDKRNAFHKDLLDFLYKRMMAHPADGPGISGVQMTSIWKAPRDEQVATWTFVLLDRNKSKSLEKAEWKAFKDIVGGTAPLRKCGKRLPRFCDTNKDRLITMTEWLDCLNVSQNATISNTMSTASPNNGRTGKNPLHTILRGD